MEIEEEKLERFECEFLRLGFHENVEDGMCVMEMAAYLAGERHSDHPHADRRLWLLLHVAQANGQNDSQDYFDHGSGSAGRIRNRSQVNKHCAYVGVFSSMFEYMYALACVAVTIWILWDNTEGT